jgi:hypothetical protein
MAATPHGSRIMTFKIRSFASIVLVCASATVAMAQQSERRSQQPPVQRDDPASVGAGPTSRSPGQPIYEAPKGAPVTTDDRGVTTTSPGSSGRSSNEAPRDQGNESSDVIAPDRK